MSLEMWHIMNEGSPTGGEEEGGRSGLVSLETWHITNEDSLAGREEEGGRTFNPKILSSSMRTPSYRYSARVTISTYVVFEHRPASSMLSSTLSTIWFPFGRTSFQSRRCCRRCVLASPPS